MFTKVESAWWYYFARPIQVPVPWERNRTAQTESASAERRQSEPIAADAAAAARQTTRSLINLINTVHAHLYTHTGAHWRSVWCAEQTKTTARDSAAITRENTAATDGPASIPPSQVNTPVKIVCRAIQSTCNIRCICFYRVCVCLCARSDENRQCVVVITFSKKNSSNSARKVWECVRLSWRFRSHRHRHRDNVNQTVSVYTLMNLIYIGIDGNLSD